jgi:WD40 repeat protein
MKLSVFTLVLFLLFLVACAAEPPTPMLVNSPTVVPTITPFPSQTPDPEIISPANVNQLALRFMNMGRAYGYPSFSSDGKWLYQSSTAGTYAYDTTSFQNVQLLNTLPIGTISPDGKILATGQGLLFSVENGQRLLELELMPAFAFQMNAQETTFSLDSSLIARGHNIAGPVSNVLGVWRVSDGKLINRFEGRPIGISPDNRLITVGRTKTGLQYDEYFVDLYDIQSGKQLKSWPSQRATFLSNNRLAVESDGYTRIFDTETYKVPRAFAGRFAAFSPDEQKVAMLSGNQIHIYRVSDGKLLQKLDSGLPSTDNAILRFTPDGQILSGYTAEYYCCAGYSARLFLWQVTDGRLLADLSQKASPVFSLSPNAQTIAVGLQILKTSDSSLIVDLAPNFIDAVTNLGFTPDGQHIIVLDFYEHLYLYPVNDDMFGMPQDADQNIYLPILQPASGSSSDDMIDVPSPDGKFRAQRNMGLVTIVNTSNEGDAFQIPTARVKCFAFSPDGQILAIGSADGSVELWNVYNSQKLHSILPRASENSYSVGGLAFSPDGKLLAVGLWDGTVRLYGINMK